MSYSTALLIGEKELQGKTNPAISAVVGFEQRVVAKVLNGNKDVKISQLEKVANALGLNVKIEFEKVEELAVQS